jgi:hypothetical protein
MAHTNDKRNVIQNEYDLDINGQRFWPKNQGYLDRFQIILKRIKQKFKSFCLINICKTASNIEGIRHR